MLLFKKQFLPAIRQGRKCQTIRLWPYRRMRAGQRSYIPGVGPIRILAVDPIRLEELTHQDAVADGFECVEELRAALEQIYANVPHKQRYRPYRVRFQVLEQPKPHSSRST